MRASYQRAVEWIAMNDEDAELNPGEVALLVSVGMVADLWGKHEHEVALAVVRVRKKERKRA